MKRSLMGNERRLGLGELEETGTTAGTDGTGSCVRVSFTGPPAERTAPGPLRAAADGRTEARSPGPAHRLRPLPPSSNGRPAAHRVPSAPGARTPAPRNGPAWVRRPRA